MTTATRYPTRCPSCNGVVHHTHRCPGATPDPPTPKPAEFWQWVQQARAEAAGDAQTIDPLTLPLEDATNE